MFELKGKCLSFYLKPTLLVYNECKLRYRQFTMYAGVYRCNSVLYYWLPWKRYNFNRPNDFFIEDFLAFKGSR